MLLYGAIFLLWTASSQDYPESDLVDAEDWDWLLENVKDRVDVHYTATFKPTLCYEATGYSTTIIRAFHTACDDNMRTITVAKDPNTGYIFGGYSSTMWNFVKTSASNLKDMTAFIFQLNPRRAASTATNNAYFVYQSSNPSYYGPTFGGGHDFAINYSQVYCTPSTYQLSADLQGTGYCGSSTSRVNLPSNVEWEVYVLEVPDLVTVAPERTEHCSAFGYTMDCVDEFGCRVDFVNKECVAGPNNDCHSMDGLECLQEPSCTYLFEIDTCHAIATPTPIDPYHCERITDLFECYHTPGCTETEGLCASAEDNECAELERDDCVDEDGCAWDFDMMHCMVMPTWEELVSGCSKHGDATACNDDFYGCEWNEDSGKCEEPETVCGYQTEVNIKKKKLDALTEITVGTICECSSLCGVANMNFMYHVETATCTCFAGRIKSKQVIPSSEYYSSFKMEA